MSLFLFRFGFCTPEQWRANEAHGWDDESSGAFFVKADTKEVALSWGCEVAELFCGRLFQLAKWPGEIPSWKGARFAFWLEADPDTEFSADSLRELPVVSAGEVPDFSFWNLASTSPGQETSETQE